VIRLINCELKVVTSGDSVTIDVPRASASNTYKYL